MPKVQGATILDKIVDCINGHLEVSVYYDGDQQNVRGWRRVIFVSVGNHATSGNMVCRVYQYAGDSASQPLAPAGWRLFLVDKITNIEYIRTYKSSELKAINPKYRAEKQSNGSYKAKDIHIPKPIASATFNLSLKNKAIGSDLSGEMDSRYLKSVNKRTGKAEYDDEYIKKHRRAGDHKTQMIEKFNQKMGEQYSNKDAERLYFIFQKLISQIKSHQGEYNPKYSLYKPEVDFLSKVANQGVEAKDLQGNIQKILSMI